MEVLWNLEDKWKLSTQEAFLIFVCTALAFLGLCTTAILKNKKKRVRGAQFIDKELGSTGVMNREWSESSSGWGLMKKALIGTVCWSGANKWDETDQSSRPWRQSTAPSLLGGEGSCAALESGCWSHNSVSPVWQRPILMGEKCELPRFSGLILYDEQGRSLHHSDRETVQQERSAAPVVTTLRDLLY